ncbi:hypothetical protein PIROE2DRAFT_6700 [Piromyces sp. E2]|nr:hypothetical protein PIROE2DRAFT_6700 [Piromyces sp. E2]|eukprot:OUM66171.1 hypothetical protein PIROE2DRAFT_6700 [Piromyces sp. E2]
MIRLFTKRKIILYLVLIVSFVIIGNLIELKNEVIKSRSPKVISEKSLNYAAEDLGFSNNLKINVKNKTNDVVAEKEEEEKEEGEEEGDDEDLNEEGNFVNKNNVNDYTNDDDHEVNDDNDNNNINNNDNDDDDDDDDVGNNNNDDDHNIDNGDDNNDDIGNNDNNEENDNNDNHNINDDDDVDVGNNDNNDDHNINDDDDVDVGNNDNNDEENINNDDHNMDNDDDNGDNDDDDDDDDGNNEDNNNENVLNIDNGNTNNNNNNNILTVNEDYDTIREYKGGEIEPEWEWVKDISIVYTWVDGSDIDFLDLKSKYNGGVREVNSRDRSADELRYSLRSLEKYLPWHRGTIYIVTCQQIPKWLDTSHPRIKMIYHKDIFPEHIYPTYDSGTIELFFDKIPGITERFIYFNDDIFINSYIHPSFFFTSYTYYPKVYRRFVTNITSKRLDDIIKENNIHRIFQASKYFTREIVRKYFDENFKYRDLFHTGHVFYRDLYEPFRQLFKEELRSNCSNRFRNPYKFQIIYLYQTFMQYATQHEDFPNHFGGNGTASQFPGYKLPKNRTVKKYACEIVPAAIGNKFIKFGQITDNSRKNNRYFNLYRTHPNILIYNFNDAYSKENILYEFTEFMITRYPKASSFEKKNYVDLEEKVKPQFDEVNEFSRYIQSGIPLNYNKYNLSKFRDVLRYYKNIIIKDYIGEKDALSGKPKTISDRELEEMNVLSQYQGERLDRAWKWAKNISFVYILENGDEEEEGEVMVENTPKYELLKLSIRSLEKYLPWHTGNIYIVTQKEINNKKVKWAMTNSKNKKVIVVHQSTLIPEMAKSTRNRHVIEMYLDKIPNLTERFVLLKSNHFFINYTHPRFFFSKEGYPKYNLMNPLTKEELNDLEINDKPFIHTYNTTIEYFGPTYVTTYRKFKDAPYPLYRDLFEPVRQLYREQVDELVTHINYDSNDFLPLYMVSTYNIYGTEQPFYPDYVAGYGKIRDAPLPILPKKRNIQYYGFDITSPLISDSSILSNVAFTSIVGENTDIIENIKKSKKLFMNIEMKRDDEYITLKDVISYIITLYGDK